MTTKPKRHRDVTRRILDGLSDLLGLEPLIQCSCGGNDCHVYDQKEGYLYGVMIWTPGVHNVSVNGRKILSLGVGGGGAARWFAPNGQAIYIGNARTR